MMPAARPAGFPRPRAALLVVLGASALWVAWASLFTTDITESGVITRFGRVVRVIEQPGLHLKLPFERVVPVDRRLLYSKPAEAEYLTEDKKNVVIRSLAIWRIADPERFLATLATRGNAEVQLADIVLAELGAALGNYSFAALVSSGDQASRFQSLIADVRSAVEAYALPTYGIEVVNVAVRQLSLPGQNQQSVFERMKAERGKIAKQYRSEGERDSSRMIAEAEAEKTRIAAGAYKEAARLRAEGDAEAMRIYADAFGQDAPFYKFLRTLQTYETVLDDRTTLFLPADSELLQILQASSAANERNGPGRPGAPRDNVAADGAKPPEVQR
jgi:membrane protease subunit HflC